MIIRRILITLLVTLSASSCGGGGGHGHFDEPGGLSFADIVQPAAPAVAGAPFAAALADCTFNASRSESCSLERLPFLGQETSSATVDKVMERVLATDPWMVLRFRQVLETLPADTLQMMLPTTAIVIGRKVRPSFYLSDTGAIYLDPGNLWLTQAELATIDKSPDFRSGFGDALKFVDLSRYVVDNDYAFFFYPLDYPGTRTIDDIRLAVARLLFHELTHAADFMPPDALASLSRNQLLTAAIDSTEGHRISDAVEASFPLRSTVWRDLAGVLFRGDTATSAQRALTPLQASDAFEPDRASDPYGYTDQYEDIAMLAEETLMQFHFGIQRDLAFTNRPSSSTATGDDFIVAGGVRGRIRTPRVAAAAQYVLEHELPGEDFSSFFATLPPPTPMRVGESWTSNLVLDGSGFGADSKRSRIAPDPLRERLPVD